jgi:hypothetical protein
MFLTLTVTQQAAGTSRYTALAMFENSSTAAGVTIIVDDATGSPLIVIAREIGSTVPPVRIAIFPLKKALNLARHWLVMPRKVTKPLPSLWIMEQLPHTGVSVNKTFCAAPTVCRAFAVISILIPPL